MAGLEDLGDVGGGVVVGREGYSDEILFFLPQRLIGLWNYS